MKKTKHFTNPTEFFFHQSMNPPTEYRQQIDEFVSKLIDLKKCVLCKSLYDIQTHVPRILIHCGHTFCTPCLNDFFRNFRVRCPLCLKLIKNIENIERLPINHTIFSILAGEHNAKKPKGQEEIDLKEVLLAQFAQQSKSEGLPGPMDPKLNNFMAQDTQMQMQQPLKTIPNDKNNEEELDYCEFHNERVKHFYCLKHKSLTCRVCTELMHGKEDCAIVDLYEVEDVGEFLAQAQKFNHEDIKGEDDNAEDKDDNEGKGEGDEQDNEDFFEDEGNFL